MAGTIITRRSFLKGATILSGCTLFSLPKLLWAAMPTNRRLLVVVLRGAMDGLGAVPAIGDKDYHAARGGLAFTDAGLVSLDGIFALNAALQPFKEFYGNKELIVMHAAATPYRDRSHFDAQDLLENGTTKPHLLSTGWLGRTVDSLGGSLHGIAIGPTVPLLLQGKTNTESWSPSILPEADQDFMARVSHMYEADPILSQTVNPTLVGSGETDIAKAGDNGRQQRFTGMMQATAQFMSKPDGPRIASIDLDGWDTHSAQGLDNGRLGAALRNLTAGITAFRQGMGSAWSQTAVLIVTEFGRTVMANGTGGTDHGTGGVAFLLGGNVAGGRVIGDWPGLSQQALYQGRDLYPANDLRSLLKAVLQDHMQVPDGIIEETVFPDSRQAMAYKHLFNATP